MPLSWKDVRENLGALLTLASTLMTVIGSLTYLYYQNQQNTSDIAQLKASMAQTQIQETEVRHLEEWQTQHKREMGDLQKELRDFQALMVEQRTVLRALQETLQEVRQDVRQLMQRFWKPGVWEPWKNPLGMKRITL